MTSFSQMKRSDHARAPVPGVSIVVSEVLLPCVTFPGVNVRRMREETLGLVERFVLESGLRLGPFDAEDIEAVTSIPARAGRRFLDRLVRTGTLTHLGEGLFAVREEAARRALEETCLREEIIVPQDFLWLPRTGDLIAMRTNDPGFTLLREIQPAAEMGQVPEQYASRRRLEWLEECIVEGTVLDLSPEIIGIKLTGGGADSPLPDKCSAFWFDGCVREGRKQTEICLRPLDQEAHQRGSHRHPGLVLPAACVLRKKWAELAAAPAQPAGLNAVAVALDLRPSKPPPSIRATGEAEYALTIIEDVAQRRFDQERELLNPIALTVVSPERTQVVVHVRLQPADPPRAFSFALATVILQLLNTDPAAAPAAEVLQEAIAAARAIYSLDEKTSAQVNPGTVREALWKHEVFAWIYRLREKADFPYGDKR